LTWHVCILNINHQSPTRLDWDDESRKEIWKPSKYTFERLEQ